MAIKRYNATLRNLEYRLRAFKDSLPVLLEDIVRDKEDVIVSAIADDQLYRRGINGKGKKIMDYMPYTARTIKRLGARKVIVTYRRAREQMPAEKKEIEDAINEGIEFLFQIPRPVSEL